MFQNNMNRRTAMLGMLMASTVATVPAFAGEHLKMHVLKDPNCGCCGSWVQIMRRDGFDVTVQNISNAPLFRYKQANGISEELTSCHTAKIGSYLIEGHVPAADIRRLLSERPEAIGLSVPGMPYGSPGMGPESERDAYKVMLIRKDGAAEVFSRYDGG